MRYLYRVGLINVFDSYVYGVQVSDASLAEVARYSGLGNYSVRGRGYRGL